MAVRASPVTCVGARFEETSTTAIFRLGEECLDSEGGLWTYIQANGAVSINSVVQIPTNFDSALCVTGTSTAPRMYGIAQIAFADNEYGWVWRGGGGGNNSGIKVNVLASCVNNVKLYTSATSGALDDASAGQTLIQGLVITTTNGGSTAAVECFSAIPLVSAAQD